VLASLQAKQQIGEPNCVRCSRLHIQYVRSYPRCLESFPIKNWKRAALMTRDPVIISYLHFAVLVFCLSAYIFTDILRWIRRVMVKLKTNVSEATSLSVFRVHTHSFTSIYFVCFIRNVSLSSGECQVSI
jgi:hypothetical protein